MSARQQFAGRCRGRRAAAVVSFLLAAVPMAAAQTAAFPSLDEISSPLTITLPGPPRATYSTRESPAPADRKLASAVALRWPRLSFSSRLSQAARAYAQAEVASGRSELPQHFLVFLLSWAGCVENDAVVITVASSEDSDVDVMNQLAQAIDAYRGQPFSHLGMGRVAVDEPPFRWRWAAILSRRLVELRDLLPRSHGMGDQVELRFRLADPLSSPRAVLVHPDGVRDELSLELREDGWTTVEFCTGTLPGTLWLELLASAPAGSVIAARLPLSIGDDDVAAAPTVWHGRSRPDESFISTTAEAERLMLALVNAERARHGLPALDHDPVLAELARAHSSDMRAQAFFDHVSPSRGGLKRRLAHAGYQAVTARENICKASTVHGAHESLLQSPSHRANIVADDVESVGIGMVIEADEAGLASYVVTQVFATPLRRPSAEQVSHAVAELVSRRRREIALRPLRRLPQLDRVAHELARAVELTGELDGAQLSTAHGTLDAQGLVIREMQAEMLTTGSGDVLSLSELVARASFNAVGMGVIRGEDGSGMPRYTVVILFAEMRLTSGR